MSDASHDEMTQQLLALLDQLRSNQRRICVDLAITVVCTTALLVEAFWRRTPGGFVQFLPFLGLLVVGVVAMWFVASCGGHCVDVKTDKNHCGGCGLVCAGACINGGVCVCSGICVGLVNDPKNCGGCGKACAAGQSCVAGQCV